MTAPEVEWVLETIDANHGFGSYPYGSGPYGGIPLRLVDRDNSLRWEEGTTDDMEQAIRKRTDELKQALYAGATLVERNPTPIGTEYDHQIEAVVGLRIEGLHEDKWGYIDPLAEDGPTWNQFKRAIRFALLQERTYPDAGNADTTYTDLQFTNPSDVAQNHADYYRYDVDVVFSGYEELP